MVISERCRFFACLLVCDRDDSVQAAARDVDFDHIHPVVVLISRCRSGNVTQLVSIYPATCEGDAEIQGSCSNAGEHTAVRWHRVGKRSRNQLISE